ncbi:12166_t:CDS:2 [Gigaspora margarita]|uniref:12166_t:CDS:1 n=1 Tax=Gigaspora margarita TaxID=4874 RepID=A0ABN7UY77_GIGMA|nr:12166_t:CDS:2 [Gigaspora margarita]
MEEIREIVSSQKGMNKINVCGCLMVKEWVHENMYYWCCEKRKSNKYKGHATTVFINSLHYLKKFNDHNYVLQASSAEVARSIAFIRDRAHETNNQPTQIIQNTIINIPKEIYSYVPSQNACDSTLSGEDFLVRDSVIKDERILLFTTKANIQHLSKSSYWMMDGTFKTVPTIFRQLYTIHAPIEVGDNTRVLPLVYALMTKKSEDLYRALFQDLIEFTKENNILLGPTTILTDFELAAINASHIEFPNVNNKSTNSQDSVK